MNHINQGVVQGGDPIVVKLGGNGAENRHIDRVLIKCFTVALDLFANIAHRIFAAAFFKFIDNHQVGKIQHIDFFQLGSGAEFTGHHIDRYIHQIGDAGIALSDSRCFSDNQVKTGRFYGGDGIA